MTATAVPAFTETLVVALVERRAVQVTYHGRKRVVCPHAIGRKGERVMLLAYQVGGETSTGSLAADPTRRWRCLYVDEIEGVAHHDGGWQSAGNYDPACPFPAADDVTVAV